MCVCVCVCVCVSVCAGECVLLHKLYTVRPICHCSVYNSAMEVGEHDLVSTGLAISNTQ